jgi:hypothetical protein
LINLRGIEDSLITTFSSCRGLCVLLSTLLSALDLTVLKESDQGVSSAINLVITETLSTIMWNTLKNLCDLEVSLCDGVAFSRLLVIIAVRHGAEFQDQLCNPWSTDALIQLSYAGILDEHFDKEIYRKKLNPETIIDYQCETVLSSGYFSKETSRWYPVEETGSWKKLVETNDKKIKFHRDNLMIRSLSLSTRICSSLCYWNAYRNSDCCKTLSELRTFKTGHTAVQIRSSKSNAVDQDSELCWIQMIELAEKKASIVHNAIDYNDNRDIFRNKFKLLTTEIDKIMLSSIISTEDEPVFLLPNARVESLDGSIIDVAASFRYYDKLCSK